MGEVELAALLCAFLAGGEVETRAYFDNQDRARHVRVDCETARHVIEVGLDDTASARDSLHQALFSAHLTGKIPVVVLIDRDGRVGRYEREMRVTTRAAGVPYLRCSRAVITRWAATAPPRRRVGDDLPDRALRPLCDLSALAAAPGS